jgi:purine-binding chemotaxis protein CheW
MNTMQRQADGEPVTGQHQYLTFTLGAESFGIDILRVQEIKGYTAVTPIPNAPPHIRGVLNLRGTIVPVVDLRSRFGMPAMEPGRSSVIVMVSNADGVVGLVVDAVSDVVDVAPADVVPPPDLGPGSGTSFLVGLAKTGEQILSLLAIDQVIPRTDSSALAA